MARTKNEKLIVTELTLVLTGEEASALLAVLRKVGGSPGLSRRRYADDIRLALIDGGVKEGPDDTKGEVTFCNEDQVS